MRSVDGQVCPKCGNGILIDLPSINKKMCSTCLAYFEWSLKDGQKSVTIDKYIGGRDEEETAHVRRDSG